MARLTDNQMKQIEALRENGSGYVRIAKALGISLSTVKSYCRRHALTKETLIVEESRKDPAESIHRTPKAEKAEPVCDVTLSFMDESDFSLKDLASILTHCSVGR